MRFQKMDEVDGWYRYSFCTTFRNGWEDILDLGRTISDCHEIKEDKSDKTEGTSWIFRDENAGYECDLSKFFK